MPRFPSGCGGFVFGGLRHGPGRPIGPVLPMRTRAGEVPAEPVTGPLAILAGHRAEPLAAADVSQSWFADSRIPPSWPGPLPAVGPSLALPLAAWLRTGPGSAATAPIAAHSGT